ncbi:glycoprotein 3-alpha-L-fucosyltransferase A [Hydra vulgaris]|uniref:glycoprotein 3-alpha-L-fucosyltransferase A n=1 Tax=Hydra vulgaris TaxID=6087 RepID=UPI0001924F1A|nr:glycoprotein 3-alpha-L-fucosyltransferase A [Hydra vulgaris]
MRKKYVVFTFLLLFLAALCIYELSTNLEEVIILPEKPVNSFNRFSLKSILLWNDLFGKENWGFPRSTNYDFKELECRVQNCFITTNRDLTLDADAVIFHISGKLNSRPKLKPVNQRWVFLMHEAPCLHNFKSLRQWNSLFNWTMTYRLDSDIPIPYVHTCKKRNSKVNLLKKDIMGKKKKLAAWMVSNCNSQSQRNQYMNELLKYIPVDIFGKCSALFGQNNKCEKNDEENCMNMISSQYKFYFSFENSFSVDYATEKFIKVLNTNAVPVVRGDANYTVLGPPNSFIDTKKFKSAKHLAEYLLRLDQNEVEYLEFLKWKEDYEGHDCGPGDIVQKRFCDLCEKLNSPQSVKSVYTNIYDWYHKCREPNDLNV